MKKQKLATLASCLLALGCSLAPQVPGEKFSRSATAPGVAGTVGLSVQLRTAKTLLDTAHRWTVADINLYRVELWKSDDGTTFADTGVGRDVSQVTAPVATSATFSNLQGGKKYRVKVQAWGSANAATADTLLDTTPATVDYDFTGQDLGATLPGTATVNLDPVAFSGTATVNLSNTPATTASEVVELWSQGSPDALVATQTFASVPTSAIFGGLSAGPTYYAKVTAKDAGAATLATGTSATVHYDPAGQDVEQNATVALTFVNAVQPTGSVLGTFTVGTTPCGVVTDPISHNVWVANAGAGTLTELSPTGTLISNIAVGTTPKGVAIDPANHNVWVVENGTNKVRELSSTGSLIGDFTVGSSPVDVAVDSSGNAWVMNNGATPGTVEELTSTGSVLGTFNVGAGPQAVAIDPVSHNVWTVAAGGFNSDLTELSSARVHINNTTTTGGPVNMALDSKGDVWVVSGTGGAVKHSHTNLTALSSFLSLGGTSSRVAVDEHDNVWVTSQISTALGKVTELSSTGGVIGLFTVGHQPLGVAVDGIGHVWVTNSGDGTVMELQD